MVLFGKVRAAVPGEESEAGSRTGGGNGAGGGITRKSEGGNEAKGEKAGEETTKRPDPGKTPSEHMRYFKNRGQMGRVRFVKENCVVAVDGTFCGACDEHCPTKAVSMIPYGDPEKGLTIPHVDESICIGCGGCESICPARPYKAIYVEGCERQGLRDEFNDADTMSEEEVKEKTGDVDDWLFD